MKKTKPTAKVSRRLKIALLEKHQKYLIRRPYPPGKKGKRGKGFTSEYGRQLAEKQKIRFLYGISEKQLKNYVKAILEKKEVEDKGEGLIKILEKRLDNVIYRAGLASTRPQARQLIVHKFFTINGKPLNIPSYLVKKGDIISVKKNKLKKKIFEQILPHLKMRKSPSWIKVDKENLKVKIIGEPSLKEAPPPAEISTIFEFYSK